MAPQTAIEFVKGRDAKHETRGLSPCPEPPAAGSLDDLKIPITVPNSAQARSMPHGPGQKASRKSTSARPQTRNSVKNSALADSELSSLGGNSTVADDRYAAPPVEPETAYSPEIRRRNSRIHVSRDGNHEPYGENNNTNNGQLISKQRNLMHAEQNRPGTGLSYMPGDSYPPTTSGVPSADGLLENQQGSLPYLPAQRHDAHGIPVSYGQPAQMKNVTDTRTFPSREQLDGHMPESNREINRSAWSARVQDVSREVEKDVNAGFTYKKQDLRSITAHPSNMRRPEMVQHVSASEMNRAPSPMQSHHSRERLSAEGVQDVHFASTKVAPVSENQYHPQGVPEEPRPASHSDPNAFDDVFEEDNNMYDVEHKTQTFAAPNQARSALEGQRSSFMNKVELDFNPPDLYEMTYEALRNADFDFAPGVKMRDPSDDTLHQALVGGLSLDQAQQTLLFQSLNINQWEQAGDWFLERFGEVVHKIKSMRQDKRAAARIFEQEVQQRHDAVARKRKVTMDALEEMKANGAQVLQITPRKFKKSS